MVALLWGALVAGAHEPPELLTAEGPLVLLHTEVDAVVQLGMAVVDVTQTFHNPYDRPIDAKYVFPLSPGAAVRAMSMTCGGRTLVAAVDERDKARERYDEAVREGRKAALLEQQRDDLFTQEVGTICPGEAVEIALQYVEGLERTDDTWSVVFPTTVGERFASSDLDLPPTLAAKTTGRRVGLSVTLDEGLPIGSVWSDSHPIDIADAPWGATVSLADGDTLPDADLHLAWSLDTPEPTVAALVARPPGAARATVALRIEPPPAASVADPTPRELVFVLDSSCSMRGEPWDASVAVVLAALEQTHPDDAFDLVRFSDAASSLFGRPAPATPGNLARAREWLRGALVGGGTEMTSGIVHALDMPGDPEALRAVLLLTDGYIGNDLDVFETVTDHIASNDRIFALGVGSAPNRGLLEQLALHGRGDAQYALADTPVAETVATFARRIATPVLTDVAVHFGDLDLREQVPSVLPDLFAGQSLRIAGAVDEVRPTTLTVTAMRGTEPVRFAVSLDPDAIREHEAVPAWWAREAIRAIDHDLRTPEAAKREQILPIALEHHLVSRFTSLVATDQGAPACESSWIGAPGPSVPFEIPTLAPAGSFAASGGILGVRGSGTGGGGSAAGLGGLGARGRGKGVGNFGAKGAARIGRVTGAPTVSGALDRSLVEDVVKRHTNKLKYCYQRVLSKHPALTGKVVVRFTIAADGGVREASIRSTTLGNTAVEQCLVGQFRRMRFDAPRGGGVVVVSYPLIFEPGG